MVPGGGIRLSLFRLADVLRASRRWSDAEWARLCVSFGSVWLLPDVLTGVGTRPGASGYHPWVVVEEYGYPAPTVRCALRSTLDAGPGPAVFTQANPTSGLTQEGWVKLSRSISVPIEQLRKSEYLGRLLDEDCANLRSALTAREEEAMPSARP